MRVLQVMGCTSDQYASMERYLIEKARFLKEKRACFHLVYENEPRSGYFINEFLKSGGRLYQFKLNHFLDGQYYHNIYRLIKKEKIDIVHTYFTPTSHYLNIYLFFHGFRNVIRTAANSPIYGRENFWKKHHLKISFSLKHILLSIFVKRIICRSLAVMIDYQKLGLAQRKLRLASGGVDINKYQFSYEKRKHTRKMYGISENCLLIGVFCRLVKIKNVDKLIKNFNNLEISRPEIRLIIAGDGPELGKLKKLVESLNLEDSVILLGRQNNVYDLYSALDIFCLPSSSEGMSNSILEAMACKLPVLASDISANRELIDEGKGGYLITFDNIKEFNAKVENLLDREIRREMGIYNRIKIANHYGLGSRVEKEFAVYQELFS